MQSTPPSRLIGDRDSLAVTSRRSFLQATAALSLATLVGSGGWARSGVARSGRAPVEHGALHYELIGFGTPVVLVPAYGFDTRCWDFQVPALASNHRVIRYDPRGFGRSTLPFPGQPYSHQDDLTALLDYLHIDRAHIVGISNGGRIAIGFALARPDRTISLTAADASVDGHWPPPEFTRYFVEAHRTATTRGPAAAKEELITTMPAYLPAMAHPALAARIRAMTRTFSGWQFLRDDPERPSFPDADARFASLAMPVLGIRGERDTPYNRGVVGAITKQARQGRRVEIPRVGHFTNMEAPVPFNRALLDFFGRAH